MKSLAVRDRQPELMDQPGLDANVHHRALAGLGKANSISRIARVVWHSIRDACCPVASGRPLRILDIASGGGDITLGVAQLAARAGIAMEAHGCDVNPTAITYAQAAARRAGITNARFFQRDALADPLDEYDVVMSTLFLHHLAEEEARSLLQKMAAAATRFVVVDDLCRNRLGYFYAWAGVRLLTRSRIVHTDGPLSVRAAFTTDEAAQLAREAGWKKIDIRTHWPERFLMSWKKS